MQKSFVDIQPSFISDDQPTELAQPSERALNHPPVLAQLLAALHSFTCNSRSDASLPESSSASLKVVPFVGMQLTWPFPSPSAQEPGLLDGLDSINHISE